MDILQLSIPPLPQFLTIGHTIWKPGMQHFERCFEVYDMLIVCSGALYMMEEGISYEIQSGEMLLMEPGRTHSGFMPCTEDTSIYWVHFKHERPVAKMAEKQIPWSTWVSRGTDSDLIPSEQSLFLPKYGKIDIRPLLPTLEDMLRLQSSLTLEHAVDVQVALGKLLSLVQAGLRANRNSTRSYVIAEQIKLYIREHCNEPFEAQRIADQLHFDFDYAARCLKQHTGLSPLQYHHLMRMEEAKRLLVHSNMPVQEIAAHIGIQDYNYFIRLFRKTVGMTPGLFRKSSQSYI
ncbi:AraC-type DNA-binding protein [Paenibacillus sp. 1_12]|uniref:helix-turn-helix transcriptional regulator n=1 Tax=Paenibacillus sp. 1_12 TaxID=1566278 RepID=UPI0008F336F0|nr:AraC family transcriptional regulator [Paenibacillus sp. 1_12]SFL16804.1 AraC-type DNA-binding protein [Paenibacillus sp. 1_12]